MIYGNYINIPVVEFADISYQQLVEMGFGFDNDSVITEVVANSDYAKRMGNFKNVIKFKSGFDLEKKFLELVKSITDIIKRSGIGKQTFDKASTIFNDFVRDIIDNIEDINDAIRDLGIESMEKCIDAALLLIGASAINGVALLIGTVLFGPAIGNFIAAIVAPFTEEMAKHIAIKMGYEKEFLIIFNISEFSQYTLSPSAILVAVTDYKKYIRYLLVRLTVVGMHVFSSAVQKFINTEKVRKTFGLDKEQTSTVSYFAGVLIHTFWNVVGANAAVKIARL